MTSLSSSTFPSLLMSMYTPATLALMPLSFAVRLGAMSEDVRNVRSGAMGVEVMSGAMEAIEELGGYGRYGCHTAVDGGYVAVLQPVWVAGEEDRGEWPPKSAAKCAQPAGPMAWKEEGADQPCC